MTGETLLSVIIPVYNSAAYLPQCVDSILAAGIGGLEVLLIDDGSTDNGPASAGNTRRGTAVCVIAGQENSGRLRRGTAGWSLPPGNISRSSTVTTGCSPPPLPMSFRGLRAAERIYGRRTFTASRITVRCLTGMYQIEESARAAARKL